MGVGAGLLYMYDDVVKKFTFALSSPDEFLYITAFIELIINIPMSRLIARTLTDKVA